MTTRGPAETCEGYRINHGSKEFNEHVHCHGCADAATLQAENAELRRKLEATTEAAETTGAALVATTADWKAAEARATAAEGERDEWESRWLERGDDLKLAEGERDRLRELLERSLKHHVTECPCCRRYIGTGAPASMTGHTADCPAELARAYLAAIPHTEGEADCRGECERGKCSTCWPEREASAPPKETT
jgi:hypothetical protein